jgi:hypothetical protein
MSRPKLPRVSTEDNYIWMLSALLVVFFLGALADQLNDEVLKRVASFSITAIILVAVWSMERGRLALGSRLGLTALFVMIESLEFLFERLHLTSIHLSFLLLFTVFTIAFASRQVLFTGRVDLNKIIGAICIYMLMGIGWAIAYLLVENLFPGSIPPLSGENWRYEVQEAVYFSYVSLTTLGFGDISPIQPLARYLTFMQAIVGQFYIAIVVASLIGARFSDEH